MTKELRTLEGVVFWTEISNFRKIQDLLKDKHGFVNARGWDEKYKDEEWFDDCLVYEENGDGLYRCLFHRQHQDGTNLKFKYWESKLTPEQLERDPMLEVVLEVYEMLKPVQVTNYAIEEFSMD